MNRGEPKNGGFQKKQGYPQIIPLLPWYFRVVYLLPNGPLQGGAPHL